MVRVEILRNRLLQGLENAFVGGLNLVSVDFDLTVKFLCGAPVQTGRQQNRKCHNNIPDSSYHGFQMFPLSFFSIKSARSDATSRLLFIGNS